jgi:hypothetical protein
MSKLFACLRSDPDDEIREGDYERAPRLQRRQEALQLLPRLQQRMELIRQVSAEAAGAARAAARNKAEELDDRVGALPEQIRLDILGILPTANFGGGPWVDPNLARRKMYRQLAKAGKYAYPTIQIPGERWRTPTELAPATPLRQHYPLRDEDGNIVVYEWSAAQRLALLDFTLQHKDLQEKRNVGHKIYMNIEANRLAAQALVEPHLYPQISARADAAELFHNLPFF